MAEIVRGYSASSVIMEYRIKQGATTTVAQLSSAADGSFVVQINGASHRVEAQARGPGHWFMHVDGQVVRVDRSEGRVAVNGLSCDATVASAEDVALGGRAAAGRASEGLLQSPMPGRVLRVLVAVDEVVAPRTALVVVEAMKMENQLFAAHSGRVAEIFVRAGETVERGARLLRIATE